MMPLRRHRPCTWHMNRTAANSAAQSSAWTLPDDVRLTAYEPKPHNVYRQVAQPQSSRIEYVEPWRMMLCAVRVRFMCVYTIAFRSQSCICNRLRIATIEHIYSFIQTQTHTHTHPSGAISRVSRRYAPPGRWSAQVINRAPRSTRSCSTRSGWVFIISL